jgi:hypothetical protein
MRRSSPRPLAIGLLLTLALGSLAAPASSRGQVDESRLLELTLGQSSTLGVTGVASYSTTGLGIVEMTLLPDGSGLSVRAVTPGETAILVIRSDGTSVRYRIRVVGSRGPRRIPAPGDLTLSVGEEGTVTAANVASYSVTPMGVVDVVVHADRGELAVTGRRVGVASIVLVFDDRHTETRRVEVTAAPEGAAPPAPPERTP